MKDLASSLGRREFAKMVSGAAALLASTETASASVHRYPQGIKIATSYQANPSDDDLLFLNQIGVEYVSLPATPETANAESFIRMRERFESGGIKVYNIGSGVGPSGSLHNIPEVTLNLPGRDQKIEEYKNYLRYLGKAGIYYTTYAHMGNGIWSSGRAKIRDCDTREFDLASPNKYGMWEGKIYKEPLSHGRVFTKEEIWDNYTYFIKQVVPVAEEAGVKIGIHPDDPPVPVLAGVPRCISGNFEGYKRAMEIADSPNVGLCLCCGTWLEGGKELTGKDPEEMIRYFGPQRKIFKIHFRNVSAPLPHFVETFMDDGYYDMYKIMKALREVEFDGIVIPDHIPRMGPGPTADNRSAGHGYDNPYNRASLAYSIGCMRILRERANREA
ncbi:MAG: mannonate dehydratase [Acidobacteriota bacterium]|nr:mannonate dehydratase [Acidobacteriota bacterium]